MKRPRRNHSPEFKALVALESLRGGHPLVSFAHRFDVHPNLVRAWQSQLLCKAARLFDEPRQTRPRQRLRLVGAAPNGQALEYSPQE